MASLDPAKDQKPISQPASECPVDHSTRASWLSRAASNVRDPAAPPSTPPTPASSKSSSPALDTHRTISTIPRTNPLSRLAVPSASTHAAPANSEVETGSREGNWVYPSEAMFFAAMRRKNHDPKERDMKAVVPIHNAVNERVWKEIREWERGLGGEKCNGPHLSAFHGDATRLSPRARFNTLLGYTAPFDRHDWIVDRCGVQIEYIIDFYPGKGPAGLSFYLDVRPKLNSFEGCRMRVARVFGWR
ncbi:MAG: Cytochrome c1 heme lyase [Vezdaea aestivalis]|nr:MAG: Cytochrome c1 heme lyase [Vezdaea aestivalis]